MALNICQPPITIFGSLHNIQTAKFMAENIIFSNSAKVIRPIWSYISEECKFEVTQKKDYFYLNYNDFGKGC